MPTQYEIELQKQLDQSRRNPVDEYSAGLLDLARFNAQQRFIQQENATRLQGQREILTQTQIAEAEENQKRFKQQKELQETLLKSQAQIQADRDKAEGLRQEARDIAAETRLDKREQAAADRQEKALIAQAEVIEKRIEAQLENARIAYEAGVKRAEIAAQGVVDAAEKRQKEYEKSKLIDKFGGVGIVREKGESDEDYIARAQKEYKGALAGQLTNTYKMMQSTANRIDDLVASAAKSYPSRLAEEGWKAARSLIPEPQRSVLEKMDPITRDARIAGLPDKLKAAKLQYQEAVKQARSVIPEMDASTQASIANLRDYLKQLNDDQSRKLTAPEYAPAIEQYLKNISPPGTPPPGAGLVPPAAGAGQAFDYMGNPIAAAGGGGLAPDFSKVAGLGVAATKGTTGAGTAPRVAAEVPVAGAGSPTTPSRAVLSPVPTTNAPVAVVDPAVAARIKQREDEAALLGSTPAEVMPLGKGISDQGLLPYLATGGMEAVNEYMVPTRTQQSVPSLLSPIARAGRFLFGPSVVPDSWIPSSTIALNPAGEDIEVKRRLARGGFGDYPNEPAPTPGEIAAFRAGVAPRVMPGPRSYNEAVGGPGLGTEEDPARPKTYDEMFSLPLGTIYRNPLDGKVYVRENPAGYLAPPLPPTGGGLLPAVTIPREFGVPREYTGPSLRAATSEEEARSQAAAADQLRNAIARHPKARTLPVTPLMQKLSTLSLPELQEVWSNLQTPIDVPGEVMP